MNKKKYSFTARIWRFSSENTSWYFVHVAPKINDEIKDLVKQKKIRTKGFSFVPVQVTVGQSTWKTTLFPSKKDPYLLSINKKNRFKEGLDEGDEIKVSFQLLS